MKADVNGRAYLKYDEAKAGVVVIADGGFDCMKEGDRATIAINEDGLPFIPCGEGSHKLDGQDDGDGYCVGIYRAEG